MQYEEEKGVCFFVYNNEQIDYVSLAILAARYVKRHLDLPVCLITNEGTEAWMYETHTREQIAQCVDYIEITNDQLEDNPRLHYDSPWTEFKANFYNNNKHKIWEYSPFEKTLLLDIDYIVKNDFLLKYFDTTGVSMFDRAISIRNEKPLFNEQWLYDQGIKMWWSTVVYFDRSEFSEMFFDTWAHVADNYDFYRYLYNFPGKLFRTDYCVSIAAHILNGMEDSTYINNFDDIPMLYLGQKDDIADVNTVEDWICLGVDLKEPWKNIVVKQHNIDLHCMNKRALGRVRNKLMEMLDE